METIRVGGVAEFDDPGKKVVAVGEAEIGVFKLAGDFYAWRNTCPHQGGPVCQGRIFKRVVADIDNDKQQHGRDYDDTDVHIVCPWHGAEYDIRTGEHAGTPDLKLSPVEIFVEADEVFIRVPDST